MWDVWINHQLTPNGCIEIRAQRKSEKKNMWRKFILTNQVKQSQKPFGIHYICVYSFVVRELINGHLVADEFVQFIDGFNQTKWLAAISNSSHIIWHFEAFECVWMRVIIYVKTRENNYQRKKEKKMNV